MMSNNDNVNSDIIDVINSTTFRVRGPDGVFRTFSLADIFGIDDTDISGEYMRQPALYAYFAVACADAERIQSKAEFNKDRAYAAADMLVRQQMEMNGQKTTEALIRSMAIDNEDYIKSVDAEVNARYNYKLLKALSSVLEQRAQMLISLGSQLRHEESTTGMAIREQQFDKSAKEIKEMLDARNKK
jgi:hypothetical protein